MKKAEKAGNQKYQRLWVAAALLVVLAAFGYLIASAAGTWTAQITAETTYYETMFRVEGGNYYIGKGITDSDRYTVFSWDEAGEQAVYTFPKKISGVSYSEEQNAIYFVNGKKLYKLPLDTWKAAELCRFESKMMIWFLGADYAVMIDGDRNIYRVGLASGEAEILSDGALSGKRFLDAKGNQILVSDDKQALEIYDLAEKTLTELTRECGAVQYGVLTADGVYYASQAGDFCWISPDGSETAVLGRPLICGLSEVNDVVYAAVKDGGDVSVYRVTEKDPNGWEKILQWESPVLNVFPVEVVGDADQLLIGTRTDKEKHTVDCR